MNQNKIKIELTVDDKGSVKVKQFGDGLDDATQKGGKGFDKLKKKIGSTSKMLIKLGAAAGVAAAGFIAKSAISQFAEYEVALRDMGKVTSESFASIQDKIMGLPSELGSATELVKGYYQTISAGVTDPVQSMETLRVAAMASKAAHVSQEDSIKALTKMMAGYQGEIENVIDASDLLFAIEKEGQTSVQELVPVIGDLAAISKESGVASKEMGGALALLTQTSGSTSEAAVKYKSVLVALMKPTGDLEEVLGNLKVTSAKALIEQHGLARALEMITTEAKKTGASVADLYGRQEAMIGVAALSANEFENLKDKVEAVGEAAGGTMKAWEDYKTTLTALWETFENTVGKQAILIGEKLAPQLKDVIEKSGAWLEANRELITEGVIVLIAVLGTTVTILGTVGKMFTGVKNAIGWVVDGLGGLVTKFKDFQDGIQGKVMDVIINFLGKGSATLPLSEKIKQIDREVKQFVGDTENAAPELLIDLEQKGMKAGLKETERGFADLEKALSAEFIDPAFLALDQFMTDWGGSWQGAAQEVETSATESAQSITDFIHGTKAQIEEFGNFWNFFWADIHAPELAPGFDGNIIGTNYDNSYKYMPDLSTVYNYDYRTINDNSYHEGSTYFHKGGLVRHAGGIIPRAHSGMFIGPKLRSDERHIVALTGEGVVNREGMADIGGEQGLNAINKGQVSGVGGQVSGGVVNLTINANVITTEDVDSWLAERMLRLNQHRVGGGYQEADMTTVGIDL